MYELSVEATHYSVQMDAYLPPSRPNSIIITTFVIAMAFTLSDIILGEKNILQDVVWKMTNQLRTRTGGGDVNIQGVH